MPKSFGDYAASEGIEPKPMTNGEFFDKNPHLIDEIVQAKRNGFSYQSIFFWLKADYDYPSKHSTAIRKHLEGLGVKP